MRTTPVPPRPPVSFLGFGLRLLGIFGLFCLLLALVPRPVLAQVNVLNAAILGRLLGLLGVLVSTSGVFVTVGGFRLEIIYECSALYALALTAAYCLAYPVGWAARLGGVAACLPLLFAVNQARLVAISLVGLHFPRWFSVVHYYVAQTGMILFVLGICLGWSLYVTGRRPPLLAAGLRIVLAVLLGIGVWFLLGRRYHELVHDTTEALLALVGIHPRAYATGNVVSVTATGVNLVVVAAGASWLGLRGRLRILALLLPLTFGIHVAMEFLTQACLALGFVNVLSIWVLQFVHLLDQLFLPLALLAYLARDALRPAPAGE